MRRGRGGTSRSSHHSTGRLSRPSSTSGWAKPSGRPAIMRASPARSGVPAVDADAAASGAQLAVQLQQQLGRRPVGAVDGEAPAEPVGLGADLGAVALDPRLDSRRARSRRGPP